MSGVMLVAAGRLPAAADAGWVEPKYDGWRATVTTGASGIVVRTRTGRRVDVPELDTLELLGAGHAFDGELVVGQGRLDDFYPLAGTLASRTRPRPLTYVVFDITVIGGRDVTAQPTEWRRAQLEQMGIAGPHVALVPRFPGTDRDDLLRACESMRMEGIVWKAPHSRYRPGVRSSQWLKFKTDAWMAHAPRRRGS